MPLPLVVSVLASLASLCSAAVPIDLANFQDEYACDNVTVRIVRPKTVKDIQDAVKMHAKVKGVGLSYSWNQPFFCADGSTATVNSLGVCDSHAANIVVSTIRPLNISVDEDNLAVDVDAGVPIIDLLQYLGNYATKKSPTGYALPAFPWFVYQSIGGAVATGTHGSSLTWNSLSHQVLALTVVTANGTLRTFTNETDPFLMRAMRVSLGQLGVITRLRLRIVKEQPVHRTLDLIPSSRFLDFLGKAQAQYRQNATLPAWVDETEFFWIPQRSEFMMVQFTRSDVGDAEARHQVLSTFGPADNSTLYNSTASLLQDPSFTSLEQLPLLTGDIIGPDGLGLLSHRVTQRINSTINAPAPSVPLVETFASTRMGQAADLEAPMDDVHYPSAAERLAKRLALKSQAAGVDLCGKWETPTPKPPTGLAPLYTDISRAGVLSIANNATLEAHDSYLYQPAALITNIHSVLYDQYEFAIPVDTMADCFTGLLNLVYKGDIDGLAAGSGLQDRGFRTAPLIRFIGKEDGLLSYTNDGPRIFINIEDYVFYNAGRKTNKLFKAVVAHFRGSPACGTGGLNGTGARLHWGKAGWPDPGCWHGDKEYPTTWCDFGCAKMELDPLGKFSDNARDRWSWEGMDLKSCCGKEGFLRDKPGCTCSVTHERNASTCPPAPFYTNR